MNIIKALVTMALSVAATSCMVVPPETGGSASVYSTNDVSSQQPVIIQQPAQQPIIIQQPAQPVIIQQPEYTKQHCYDPHSGEYLKVSPHSNRCREWLRNNQQERDRHHFCIDRKTGHPVNGVPAHSPECHRINNPPRHQPPRHQPPPTKPPVQPPAAPIQQPVQPPAAPIQQPVQPPAAPIQQPVQPPAAPIKQPIQQPAAPIKQPVQQPAAPIKQPIQQPAAACIDKRTGKPVDGVSANDLRCAKINR